MTAVTEIEAILNSRPLSYVSTDNIEEPLTPFHLLSVRRLYNLPDELCFHQIEKELTTTLSPVLLDRRMRHLQLTYKFWKRWKLEYLLNLRKRYQYKTQRRADQRKIQTGDIVIVHDDQAVRGFWRLGKIRELITGLDGQIRGAVVDTVLHGRSSVLKHPVQKLIPLEVNQNEEETDPPEVTTDDQEEVIDDSSDRRENISEPEFESLKTTAEPQSGISTRSKRSAAIEAQDKIFARLCED